MNNDASLKDIARMASNNPKPEAAKHAEEEVEYFNFSPTNVNQQDQNAVSASTIQQRDLLDTEPTFIIGTNINKAMTNPNPEPISQPITNHPFANDPATKTAPKPVMPDLSDEDLNISTAKQAGMSEEDLKNLAPHMPDDLRNKSVANAMEEKSRYVKRLILDGFSPEEAEEAAKNRFNKTLKEEDTKYAEENPELGIVRVDKTETAVDDLALTPEEHEKLVPTKAIKLVLVEDADLKNIEIENIASEHKVEYLRCVEGSLSKYGVPIPIYGDFMQFSGAQLIQIANMEARDDDRLEDDLNRKASLIYSKLIGGTLIKKVDENGKSVMSYQEFVNKFSYMDIDMAIFGILCASNPEEGSTSLTCNKCQHVFEHKYNFKHLMTMEGLSDDVKQRYEDVLENRTNANALARLHKASNSARRYKSPFTNNIYDVAAPSVARMIDIFKRINQSDSVMVHNSVFAAFLNAMYIYNKNTGKYIKIDDSEVDLMLDTISDLPQDDITMIQKQIKQMSYSPRFKISGNCPSCNSHYDISVSVDTLLFFKQRDLQREIE